MDMQTAIVAVIVSVSALYLAHHWLRMLQGKTTGCHTGCSGCPHNKACPSVAACEAEARKKESPVKT
ncbi:MAG: FeoB-associated Cys-rich membrane protein [FCB group bacterium]|jgi:hypothetical protein|nr:FeoB-associated Cys-rich membrane protein [FCB group bacterium]